MPPTLASARLVGRDAELGRLASILDAAAAGSARTLLVTGSSGAGVTRFLADASSRLAASADGWAVLRASVPAGGADEPYGPILRALAPHLTGRDDAELASLASTSAPSLAILIPELADRLGRLGLLPGSPEVMPRELAQSWVLERLLAVAGRIAGERPLLFTVEDLHRADSATRAFVSFVARGDPERRLCLVGTYAPDEMTRDSPLHADLAELNHWPRQVERLAIPPLGRDDLASLIAEIEGERPTASALVLVAERSAGFPLFAEEVLAARRELASTHLAGDFDTIVSARLALRTPECRRVVRLLAAAARPLSRDQLADLDGRLAATAVGRIRSSTTAPRPTRGALDADLAAGLDEALATGIAVEQAAGLEVRHELIGRAVMRDILPGDRPRYHASVAVTLADRPAVASLHWRRAGQLELAGAAAAAAADWAAAVAAPRDELLFLETALELAAVAARPPGDARPSLQVRAAEAAFSAGLAARAVAYAEAAMEAAPGRVDREGVGMANERLGRYRRATGDHAGALAAHRRAADLVAQSAPAERAQVLASLAQVLMLHGTFSEAEQQAAAAIEQATAAGPDGTAELVRATTTLGVALAWGHEPERGYELLEVARDRASARGDLDELFRVYANLTTVLDLLGRREEAVRVAYEGIAAAREAGLEQVYGDFLRSNAAESLFLLGRWSEARAFAAAGWTGDPTSRASVNSVVNLAVLEIETQAGETAENLLGQLLLTLETVNDPQHAVPVYRAAASLALWLGDLADARRMSDRGWSQVRTTEDWILAAKMAATVAEVDAAAATDSAGPGDLAAILAARGRTGMVLREAGVLVRASGVPAETGSRREADAFLQAAKAFQARIDGLDEPDAWHDLATTWASLGNRYEVARARWREAEAAMTVGGGSAARARARGAVEAAAGIAIDLGARPLLRALSDLAGRARLPLSPAVRTAFARLEPTAEPDAGSRPPLAPAPVDGSPSAADLLREPGQPPTGPGQAFGLSRRERDVLALIVRGRTNREIGERLFISQKTVGVHVGNILAKLNVSGRVEAATVALRLGLVDPDAT